MNPKHRIASILKTNHLDASITGLPAFNLSNLKLKKAINFELPTNIRLGHLAEKIVSELIKASSNYMVLYENLQIVKDKNTIGEIDFIIKDSDLNQLIHMELAYKFYLYDPSLSLDPINNWIGPNRNDSLSQKLEKLKRKQFPLLYHSSTKPKIESLDIDQICQALCLLVSLFIPYQFKGKFHPNFEQAIVGYYLYINTFKSLHTTPKTYYLPLKKEWGMNPAENKSWVDFSDVETRIKTCMNEKQAPLVWEKCEGEYLQYFVVWW